MVELPLFPLNTVLFPGMPLPLHIFEERYKQMVQMCLDEERPFGVLFNHRSVTAGGPEAGPRSIGCTARIAQVEPLAEGRLLIMTVGQERFRVVSINHDQPFLTGEVELIPLEKTQSAYSAASVDRLHPLVVEYLDILSEIGETTFETTQIPTDPERFAYLAAAFIQLPQEEKQPLLETDDANVLFRELQRIYRREVFLMRTIPKEDQGIFSMN